MDPTVSLQLASTGTRSAAGPSAQATPNDQVVVGYIPAQRPGFQPRPALLARLNQAGQGPSVVVLTGAGGVGKTQLAAAYARARLAGGWRLIAWVSARDSESLRAGLALTAEAMPLSDGDSRSGADPGKALRHWLEGDGSRCLLVFDDVQDPDLLRPFVPAAGHARVVIITGRVPVPEPWTDVPVDAFTAEQARALLAGRTGLDEEAGASAVAAKLRHLPLALDHAAAVIAGQHLGYPDYLARLRELRVEDYLDHAQDGTEQAYPHGAVEAVLMSLEAVRTADPVGVCAGVMEITAVLSPAAVRCDLLRTAGEAGALLGGGRRVAASMVDQALEKLNNRSLLGFSFDGQAVSAHCLVTHVVRGRLARRGRLATAFQAAASVLDLSAEALTEPEGHRAAAEMPGQVRALLENAEALTDDADEKLASVLTRLRDHPPTPNARTSLAVAGQMADLAADTIPALERTLVERERTLGPDHLDTLSSQDNLAAAYQDAGRASVAILLFRLTLAARERLLGPDHPDTLHSRTSLAAAYRDAGRAAEAIPLLQEALAIREQAHGADQPGTLAARNNLASMYRSADRPADAIPLFEQNLASCDRLFGVDDPRTVASRHNLDLARQEARVGASAYSSPGGGAPDQD